MILLSSGDVEWILDVKCRIVAVRLGAGAELEITIQCGRDSHNLGALSVRRKLVEPGTYDCAYWARNPPYCPGGQAPDPPVNPTVSTGFRA